MGKSSSMQAGGTISGVFADNIALSGAEAYQDISSIVRQSKDVVTFDASKVVPTANENRPLNSSVVYIIKAKNVKEAKQSDIDKTPYATEAKAGIVKLKNSITGSLSDTTVSEKAAKEYMDKNASIGIGQTWQDVTAQRQIGVTYTNTTGRPIALSVTLQSGGLGGTADIKLSVNGQIVYLQYVGGMNATPSLGAFWILQAGDTYSLTAQSSGNIVKWLELR